MNSKDKAIQMMNRFDGWFFDDEARVLYDTVFVAVAKSKGAIVEIGSFCGRSTTILAYAAISVRADARVYAIDPHLGNLSGTKTGSTFDTFVENMKTADLSRNVIVIRKKSEDVKWSESISVLFIDGLHDYDSVAADYRRFSRFVEPGGLVAFHDYENPDHPDVKRFVDSMIASGELVAYALPGNPCREASLIVTRKRATFSVIIPTIGRPTLKRTLDSLVAAGIGPHDEVIVVGDGPQPAAREIVERQQNAVVRYIDGERTEAFGGRQRNLGMSLATKSHLAFIDDDDEYVSCALYWMRDEAEEHPGKFIMFKEQEHWTRNRLHQWDVIWRSKTVEHGNVGTQMIVVPNIKPCLGYWPDHRGSDFGFIRSTLDKWPGGNYGVVWIDRVIAYLY